MGILTSYEGYRSKWHYEEKCHEKDDYTGSFQCNTFCKMAMWTFIN